MPGGRPLLFDNVEDLEKAIEKYFESCWEEKWTKESKKNKDGSYSDHWTQHFDRHGNALLIQTKPYVITGLALALNTSRQTLYNYQDKDEYFDTIKKAKDICENFLERGMIDGSIPAAPGIFNAKNNYGWVDKTEIDNSHTLHSMPTIKKDGKEVTFDIGDTQAAGSASEASEDS